MNRDAVFQGHHFGSFNYPRSEANPFPVRLVVQYKNSEKAMTRAHSEEKAQIVTNNANNTLCRPDSAAMRLATETVQGAALSFQGVDNV